MPLIRTYTIKSYDGSTTLFSYSGVGSAIKILTTGITIADGVAWTYEGDKTFVGVSTVPNASRCEFGIGSIGFFPDNRTVYIYEQDSPVLPFLLSCAWNSAHSTYGTLKLNGVEKPMTTSVSNYYPIYENDILTWEETAHSDSEYLIYYPAINGQIWRNNISLGGEDVVVTGDISLSHVAEGFSYTVSATYFNNTVGEKNTVWVVNDSIPASTASMEAVVKFKSNNSEWKNIWWQVLTDNSFLYFKAAGSSSHTAVYGQTTGWKDQAYRTIEFEQPIWDNELSAWLQANATKQSTSTLTFKHFFDAGLQGTGTYKFRHYSQQEPSSGETWVLNETLTNQSYGIESSTFSSNNTTYTKFARYYKTDMLGEVEQDYVAFYTSDTDSVTVYDRGTWSNTAYRTITFATAPTGDLLTWLQANGTKQGGGIVELPPAANWTATKVSGDFTGTLTLYTTNNNGNKIQCGPKGYEWIPKINDENTVTEFSDVATAFGLTEDSEGNTIIPSEWGFDFAFEFRVTNDGLDGGSCIIQIDTDGYYNSVSATDVRLLVYDASTDTMRIDTCEIDEELGMLTTKYAYGFNQIFNMLGRMPEE